MTYSSLNQIYIIVNNKKFDREQDERTDGEQHCYTALKSE